MLEIELGALRMLTQYSTTELHPCLALRPPCKGWRLPLWYVTAKFWSAPVSLPFQVLYFPWVPRYLPPSISLLLARLLAIELFMPWRDGKGSQGEERHKRSVGDGQLFVFYYLLVAFLLVPYKKAFFKNHFSLFFFMLASLSNPTTPGSPTLWSLKLLGWNPLANVTAVRVAPSWMGLMSSKRDPRDLLHYLHVSLLKKKMSAAEPSDMLKGPFLPGELRRREVL